MRGTPRWPGVFVIAIAMLFAIAAVATPASAAAGVTDAGMSTVSVTNASRLADGTQQATITVTLVDSEGGTVAGHDVTLAADGGTSAISAPSGQSDAGGVVTFTVTNTAAETVTYTATDTTDGVAITQTGAVTFQPLATTSFNGLDGHTAGSAFSFNVVGTIQPNAGGPTYGISDATTPLRYFVTLQRDGAPVDGATLTYQGADGIGTDVTTDAAGEGWFGAPGGFTINGLLAGFGVDQNTLETTGVTYPFSVTPAASGNYTLTFRLQKLSNTTWIGSTATANFTVAAAPAPGTVLTESTLSASPAAIVADGTSTSTVTVQLVDGTGTPMTTSGGTVVLSTDLGSVGPVTDNGDGTYTAVFTAGSTSGTATITGTLDGDAFDRAAQVSLTPIVVPSSVPAPPPPAPSPTPTTEVIDGLGGVTIEVENAAEVEVVEGTMTEVQTSASGGSSLTVLAPEGALQPGSTLEVAAVVDTASLVAQAPTVDGDLVLGFIVRNANGDGQALTTEFDMPIVLVFNIPADQVPAGANARELTLSFWNGTEWVRVSGQTVVNADGTATIVADVDHFTTFAVTYEEGRGQFSPEPSLSGPSTVEWGGGDFEALEAEVGDGSSLWVFVDGQAHGYTAGAPAFVNQGFMDLYPTGMPKGALGILVKRP